MNDAADNTVNRKGDDRNGSVLMETVLAMPLLMVLLGGVMWLGQLQINRARLAVADRYIAWNVANRHRGDTPSAATVDGWRIDEALSQQENDPYVEAGGFWRMVQDQERMSVTAPEIVVSLFSAQRLMAGEAATDLQVDLASPRPHFVLARRSKAEYTDDYKGSRYGLINDKEDLGIDWQQVSSEAFWEPGWVQQVNNGTPFVPVTGYNKSRAR